MTIVLKVDQGLLYKIMGLNNMGILLYFDWSLSLVLTIYWYCMIKLHHVSRGNFRGGLVGCSHGIWPVSYFTSHSCGVVRVVAGV